MRRINFGTPETNMLVREINAWRGGLLLLRHVTPLTRRYVVHFCSGAYKLRDVVTREWGIALKRLSSLLETDPNEPAEAVG